MTNIQPRLPSQPTREVASANLELTTMNTDGEPRAGTFEALIGDEHFEFLSVTFDDLKVTAAQVCMRAGRHPVEDYVVLRPTETSDLNKNKVSRFFVIKGGDTHRFFVEGLAMEWPDKKLIAEQIKFLAGAGDDHSLSLERPGVDQVFADDDVVDIGGGGAERFKLRHRRKTVTVIYGGDAEFEFERRVYTTEELMTVFGVPAGYKLDFIGSDGVFREMAPGERLKVKEGMEFASHPPVGQSS